MTNAMIIEQAKKSLAAEGLLEYTGRVYEVETDDGEKIQFQEVEEIHTFARWKDLGYMVRKGEHAIAKITIWKAASRKVKNESGELEEVTDVNPAMFMKTSAFFAAHQVERMEA